MDIGTVVNIVQIVVWSFTLIAFIVRLSRGGEVMPSWMAKLVKPNSALGLFISLGVLTSCWSLYLSLSRPAPLDIVPLEKMEQVSYKSFVNETVEVDGKHFDHCQFENVKLVFHGKKRFAFSFNGFHQTIVLFTDNESVSAFEQMISLFGVMKGKDEGVQWKADKDGYSVFRTFPEKETMDDMTPR
jgi:hypothetical protein